MLAESRVHGSSHGCFMGSRYGPILEEMYVQMEQRQRERQDEMRAAAAQGTILDKVKQVPPLCTIVRIAVSHEPCMLEEL